MIFCTLGAVLLAGLVFFFSYFHVSKVEVMGTARYSDEEVKSMALQGAFTDNSVLAVLLHSRVDVEDVPFVEGFNITRLSHNSICISVREKKQWDAFPIWTATCILTAMVFLLRVPTHGTSWFLFLTGSR